MPKKRSSYVSFLFNFLVISERDDSVTRAQCFEEKAKKLQTENEILNRAIDKHKRGTDDDVAFLENNLNALKRENQILLEHNRKLQYDYEQMMKYDQNSRQLHNENFLLMKENDELRRSLNRCCRCYQ